MASENKTNVMRILDAHGVAYGTYSYPADGTLSGVQIAHMLGQNPAMVFKTLVTIARSGKIYVFMLPVASELDLKRAASAVGEKSVDMLKSRDLLPTTGYIHGGCSPIGMKKSFPTVIDSSATNFDSIIFSAGKIGHQVHVPMADFMRIVNAHTADICVE